MRGTSSVPISTFLTCRLDPHWQLKDDSQKLKIQIKNNNNAENLMVIIASIILSAIVFVVIIQFQKEDASLFYVILESIITGLNFTAMWLMAWKRIEHWYLWIIGDIMCIPLFVFKNRLQVIHVQGGNIDNVIKDMKSLSFKTFRLGLPVTLFGNLQFIGSSIPNLLILSGEFSCQS